MFGRFDSTGRVRSMKLALNRSAVHKINELSRILGLFASESIYGNSVHNGYGIWAGSSTLRSISILRYTYDIAIGLGVKGVYTGRQNSAKRPWEKSVKLGNCAYIFTSACKTSQLPLQKVMKDVQKEGRHYD